MTHQYIEPISSLQTSCSKHHFRTFTTSTSNSKYTTWQFHFIQLILLTGDPATPRFARITRTSLRTTHISDYKPMNLHQIYSKICTINPHQLSSQTKTELQHTNTPPSKTCITIKPQRNKTHHTSNYQQDKKEYTPQILEITAVQPRNKKTFHQTQNRRKQTKTRRHKKMKEDKKQCFH